MQHTFFKHMSSNEDIFVSLYLQDLKMKYLQENLCDTLQNLAKTTMQQSNANVYSGNTQK